MRARSPSMFSFGPRVTRMNYLIGVLSFFLALSTTQELAQAQAITALTGDCTATGPGSVQITCSDSNSVPILTTTGTAIVTNKNISGATNTLSNIVLPSLSTQSEFTLVGNSTSSSASPTALAYKIIAQGSGIDPTGTNDSTTALQALITAAENNNGAAGIPAIISFPAGTFKTTSCLNVTGSNLIIEGKGPATVFTPAAGAFCVYGSANNPSNPTRTVNHVYLRDFSILGTNATTTNGLIYFVNSFDDGIDNVTIGCSSNNVSNGILVAQTGGILIKDTQVYGSDTCGGGNTNTNSGILVENNSQASIINGDVEGFNGTGGKGIATSGAAVYLDIISAHTEADYYKYYHASAYDTAITASQSGNTLTVTAIASGGSGATTALGIGTTVSVTGNPYITALGSGVSNGICTVPCTYTVSGSSQTISSAGVTTFSNGQTNIIGGNFGNGGPEIIDVLGDNLLVDGLGLTYGAAAFNIAQGGFKNINLNVTPPSIGTPLFTSGSDLSGVSYKGGSIRSSGSNGTFNVKTYYFSKSYLTSGSSVSLFTLLNFSPGRFRLFLTCDGYGIDATAYQVDFIVTNSTTGSSVTSTGSYGSPVSVLAQNTGGYTCTATFALNATTNGLILAVTPTDSGAGPSISGRLEAEGLDYTANQVVIPD